jgi:hypothetical protein
MYIEKTEHKYNKFNQMNEVGKDGTLLIHKKSLKQMILSDEMKQISESSKKKELSIETRIR